MTVKVPKDLDLRKLGPLGCGYVTGSGTVFNTLQPKPGDTIAVFGTGAVGLAAMMAGKISGCVNVIAVDIVDSRLELAKKMGATDTINSKNEDPVAAIKKITGGLGVDWAVDTTGVTKVMTDSIAALTQGGTTATIAVTPHNIDTLHHIILILVLGMIFVSTIRRLSVSIWVIQFLKLTFLV